MSRAASKFAFFARGRWRVNPPIVHPPLCVCETCKRSRPDEGWDREFVVRIDRVSPVQTEPQAIAFAIEIKRREEELLRRRADEAAQEHRAVGGQVTFGQVCEAYREYQRAEGKRLDRDRFRIDRIEEFFGSDRTPSSITKTTVKAFRESLVRDHGVQPTTVDRSINTLLAILNGAVKDGLIDGHQIAGMRRGRTKKIGRPRRFSHQQVEVLLGGAMDEFEREQRENRLEGNPSATVPIRGICLIARWTLMRPTNNLGLRWEDLSIDAAGREGTFHISKHKNSQKGVLLEGPLAPSLVDYLVSIMPAGRPKGLVHPSPKTGRPYVNIHHTWERLVVIANSMLPDNEQIGPEMIFYNWRHTGASDLAESGADPVLIVRMMADTSLATVLRHYFDSSMSHMKRVVAKWDTSHGPGAGAAAGAPP